MTYSIQEFVKLIAQLRNPNGGCPWDLKQNYQTMIPCLTEETYEVIEAIQQNNMQDLKEELGDLLLQVIFFSQLATEDEHFTFDDVVNTVSSKIIRRHPHVFGNKKAHNEQEALQNWNAIKAQENQNKGQTSILDNIPHAFPALMRAEKLQKRCAKVGFDWNETTHVIEKIKEELNEVQQEIEKSPRQQAKIEEEIGDLLFAVVNLSRHLHCQPEESLRKANHKFEQRFRAVERKLKQNNKTFADSSLMEMDLLWDEVKREEQ
ncbi:nucleoside triphosphate pyrophosphohydrolase [Pasteurella canis]|uniref:Nucleoside triphosphate pyrophosphohydrolase n=1 Tax=Pasteurella canis TaxID=753 RepID=A0A379EX46_9PAST|nr:nucleoside triphosphate pyrophosphohydrolase [Pasteurella canis]MXN89297.1 nucleoside triphosphate pyrophosphohydrolase [Pasteurella canis]UAX42018.1 nucleoside triphosphate pyrophosphohydrolase [Pasteurella canis]UAY77571.1 nucleoside triphosphate pyrophosphohydrolase [Pasteurella canis]UEA16664.1 nucleoside triphosphate pyrophosphohydrolase [Pasteurella canis]UEC23102.1 nucleoside triphosphate pyrophosphohydrolase [Pasteurella canis]